MNYARAPSTSRGSSTGRRKRADASSLQRHVGRVLLRRNHGAGRGAVRLRQRRRPRRLPRAGPGARRAGRDAAPRQPIGRALPQRLAVDADGRRTLRFTDVTAASGIAARGYGMGAAAGDFDNDGCVDLYLTSLGPNALFRNNCDGTFTDVSKAQRHRRSAWSVSAAFLDYDRDGWLDLFVGNYVTRASTPTRRAPTPAGRPDYCPPQIFQPQPSRLYHNNRNGTFDDVTAQRGHRARLRTGARRLDRRLQRRRLDRHLRGQRRPAEPAVDQPAQRHVQEPGPAVGHRVNAHGKAKAGMGVDAGDFDDDGDEDLFVTNLTGEGNDLYVNDGAGLRGASARSGLGAAEPPLHRLRHRLVRLRQRRLAGPLTVNGAVQTIEAQRRARPVPAAPAQAAVPQPRRRPVRGRHGARRAPRSSCRRSAAARRSATSTTTATRTCWSPTTAAAAAAGQPGRQPQPLARPAPVAATGRGHARRARGRRPEDGTTLWRRARSDGSYASANDPRSSSASALAGGRAVRVIWPGGATRS